MPPRTSSAAQRAEAHPDVQDGLFDRVVENEVLSKALDRREKAKNDKAKATAEFKEIDDNVRGQLSALELQEDEVIRCGRYRIKKGAAGAPTDVAFTRTPQPRITISLLD